MRKVKIFGDSTCDLTPELLKPMICLRDIRISSRINDFLSLGVGVAGDPLSVPVNLDLTSGTFLIYNDRRSFIVIKSLRELVTYVRINVLPLTKRNYKGRGEYNGSINAGLGKSG